MTLCLERENKSNKTTIMEKNFVEELKWRGMLADDARRRRVVAEGDGDSLSRY